MSPRTKNALALVYNRAAIPLGFGLIGYAINCLPVEVFPGIHLIFGSVATIAAAMKFGPGAGALAGAVSGLRASALWSQPFFLGPLLYGLEGLCVGLQVKSGKRGPVWATLAYWLLLGGWLSLAAQYLTAGLPIRLALILESRAVINGMLAGMLIELGIFALEVIRLRASANERPARLRLSAMTTLGFVLMISAPMLYISRHSVYEVRERMLADMLQSSSRDVNAVEAETGALLQNYKRGVAFSASLFSSQRHMNGDSAAMSSLLAEIHREYPEFEAMAVGDREGRVRAADPAVDQFGRSLIGVDFSDRPFYRGMMASKSTYFSGVYQARSLMYGPASAICSPITDEHGEFAGFAFGRFDLQSFQRIASRYRGDGETLVITDGEGLLLADSSLAPGSYQEVRAGDDFDLVKDQLSGTIQYSQEGPSAEPKALLGLGGTSLFAFDTLSATGWKIWSKRSLRPLEERLEQFYARYLLALMLALLFALAVSGPLSHRATRGLVELQQSIARLASGNLSERPAPRRWLTVEYESLYKSLREMAEALELSWRRQLDLLREASVAKSELETTFDAMADAVTITDLDDRLLRANRATYQIWGIRPEQAMGSLLSDIVHPNGDSNGCEICIARRVGRQATFFRKPEETPFGKHLEIRVDPIFNPAGERIGAVHVVRDLTEMRRVQAEAERSGALLRDLVDAAFDGVYAANLDGRLLWGNKNAAEMFGLDRKSLEGEHYLRSITPKGREQEREAFELAAQGKAQRFETQFQTADGGTRTVLVTNSPIYAGGEVVSVLAIIRDVTDERRALEQAIRSDKLRALGQLAWGVAHNFNNSLTAVLGYTQLVLNKSSDPAIQRSLKTVEKAALDAAKMVHRIQTFASQSVDDAFRPVDLNQTIHDALDLTRSGWRDDARAAGIAYDVIFRPGEGVITLCDQSAMREVFVNIIINAIEAMPGGGRLTITTAAEGDDLLITFADTGYGMTRETRQRIFEPFYTTKGARGQGMGLAVSYGLVERHGGEIHVTSEPGKGATFTIKLKRTHEPEPGPEPAESDPVGAGRPASILVVDDEAPIRMLLSDILRARGHKVLTAEDGLAGLRAIENMRFDMVITDLSMPGADGWTVVSETRRRWPNAKLVIVTGYGGFAELAVPGGDTSVVDALISKPFNAAEIDSTINRLLRV